jgi:exodeoxyribonuclease V alpha subunit
MNDSQALDRTLDRTLQLWREAGRLRALDLALARMLAEAGEPAGVVLGAALAAALEGAGHSGLPLLGLPDSTLSQQLCALLGWPDEMVEALLPWLAQLDPARLSASAAVAQGGPQAEDGAEPLVLDRGRLYLRRHWRDEQRVIRGIAMRCDTTQAKARFDPAWALRLFEPLPAGSAPDGQRQACLEVGRAGLTVLTGGPGTGKTYTAARMLLTLLAAQPELRIALAAPTGKAAARLRQSIADALKTLSAQAQGDAQLETALAALSEQITSARTLHSLLGMRHGSRRFRHDLAHPLDIDVLLIDEASMVHLELMAAVVDALPPQARLILLGDRDQLASVEAGSVLGDLCAAEAPALARRVVTLRRSHRFGGRIGELAAAVNAGDVPVTLRTLQAGSAETKPAVLWLRDDSDATLLQLVGQGRPGAEGGWLDLLALWRQPPVDPLDRPAWIALLLERLDHLRVLTALREGDSGVEGLNRRIESGLAALGGLRPGQFGGGWYDGRPVMISRNDPELGLSNGDVGLALAEPGGALRVWFGLGDGSVRAVLASRIVACDTAWAMTVHKSQGSEFAHTVLVLPDRFSPLLTRELLYTGLTRARKAFTLIAPDPAVLAQAVARRTERISGLQIGLSAALGRPA